MKLKKVFKLKENNSKFFLRQKARLSACIEGTPCRISNKRNKLNHVKEELIYWLLGIIILFH